MSRARKPSGRKPRSSEVPLFDRARRMEDYRRQIGRRNPERTLLIVCEGSVTEPNYFKAIRAVRRLRNLTIEIISGGKKRTTPMNIVQATENKKTTMDWDNERDEAWAVFDTEKAGLNPTLPAAIEYAKNHRIRLAISNPACEYWFLLHYECTDRSFLDADEVVQTLRQYIPHYEKSLPVFHLISDKLATAIEHARQLRERSETPWDEFPNPSTAIDQLVLQIWPEKRSNVP